MTNPSKSPLYSALFAVIAFGIAAICAFGIVLKYDTVGRVIITIIWTAIGVWWLGQCLLARRREKIRHVASQSAGN